jgi:hypothetical protein
MMKGVMGVKMAAHWKKSLLGLSFGICLFVLGLFASLTIIT